MSHYEINPASFSPDPDPERGCDWAGAETISLTPKEQLAFWKALDEPRILTPAQQRLGAIMRGET